MKRGFTLVENVIALAILALIATMTAGIFTSAVRVSDTANRRDQSRAELMASIELAAAGQPTQQLAAEAGTITLDFDGKKIEARGKFLTGAYGDEQLPLLFFLTEAP